MKTAIEELTGFTAEHFANKQVVPNDFSLRWVVEQLNPHTGEWFNQGEDFETQKAAIEDAEILAGIREAKFRVAMISHRVVFQVSGLTEEPKK